MSRGRQVHRAFSLFTLLHQSPRAGTLVRAYVHAHTHRERERQRGRERVMYTHAHSQTQAGLSACHLRPFRALRRNDASRCIVRRKLLLLAFVGSSRPMGESVNRDAVSYRDRILEPGDPVHGLISMRIGFRYPQTQNA